jgi:hypothetical protein
MLALWKNALASRPTEGDWDMSSWTPDVVVINLGINDLSPPASSETDIIAAYALLLAEVRSCEYSLWALRRESDTNTVPSVC